MKDLPWRRQRGATLIVGLIMLLLLTIAAATAFNLGTGSLQVTKNMQLRSEAVNVAQEAIDTATSSSTFLNGIANTPQFDVNGDGTADIAVSFSPQPTCIVKQSVQNSQLNPADPSDQQCFSQSPGSFGVEGSSNNNSICQNTIWEVTANPTDLATNVAYPSVTEGVAVRVAIGQGNCP